MPNETNSDFEDLDLAGVFGADAGVSAQCITLYIPNKDRYGREIGNQRKWVLEAIRLLSEINGGATAMPPVEGGWLDDDKRIIWENPVVVYSFIKMERFVESIPTLREFLHTLGRETDQGEIAFEFDRKFFRIRNFDSKPKGGEA